VLISMTSIVAASCPTAPTSTTKARASWLAARSPPGALFHGAQQFADPAGHGRDEGAVLDA
jgi:hypothetical protein